MVFTLRYITVLFVLILLISITDRILAQPTDGGVLRIRLYDKTVLIFPSTSDHSGGHFLNSKFRDTSGKYTVEVMVKEYQRGIEEAKEMYSDTVGCDIYLYLRMSYEYYNLVIYRGRKKMIVNIHNTRIECNYSLDILFKKGKKLEIDVGNDHGEISNRAYYDITPLRWHKLLKKKFKNKTLVYGR